MRRRQLRHQDCGTKTRAPPHIRGRRPKAEASSAVDHAFTASQQGQNFKSFRPCLTCSASRCRTRRRYLATVDGQTRALVASTPSESSRASTWPLQGSRRLICGVDCWEVAMDFILCTGSTARNNFYSTRPPPDFKKIYSGRLSKFRMVPPSRSDTAKRRTVSTVTLSSITFPFTNSDQKGSIMKPLERSSSDRSSHQSRTSQ